MRTDHDVLLNKVLDTIASRFTGGSSLLPTTFSIFLPCMLEAGAINRNDLAAILLVSHQAKQAVVDLLMDARFSQPDYHGNVRETITYVPATYGVALQFFPLSDNYLLCVNPQSPCRSIINIATGHTDFVIEYPTQLQAMLTLTDAQTKRLQNPLISQERFLQSLLDKQAEFWRALTEEQIDLLQAFTPDQIRFITQDEPNLKKS